MLVVQRTSWRLPLGHVVSRLMLCAVFVVLGGVRTASATSASLMQVLLPIENFHEDGFCEVEVLAYDSVTTAQWAGYALIGKALSREHLVHLLKGPEDPYANRKININPIAAGPEGVIVRFDLNSVETNSCSPKVSISVDYSRNSKSPEWAETSLHNRIKLALVFVLRNAFWRAEGSKVEVTISGLPDQNRFQGVRMYEKTRYDYTERSPHYRALVKELAAAECLVGRAFASEPPKARYRHRCR